MHSSILANMLPSSNGGSRPQRERKSMGKRQLFGSRRGTAAQSFDGRKRWILANVVRLQKRTSCAHRTSCGLRGARTDEDPAWTIVAMEYSCRRTRSRHGCPRREPSESIDCEWHAWLIILDGPSPIDQQTREAPPSSERNTHRT